VGLNRGDFQAVLDCVHTLHACSDLISLQRRMVEVLPQLVASEITALNEVDVERRHGFSIVNPDSFDILKMMPAFQAHLHEHPVIMHHSTRTGRTGDPLAISDFLPRGHYRRQGIYNEVYRIMGVEDQISLALRPGGSLLVGLSLSRKGWGFSRRDRNVLELLRPHLIQAYQNMASLSEIKARAAESDDVLERLPFGIIKLGKTGRPERITATAQALIERFFPVQERRALALPDDLLRWIRIQNSDHENSLAPANSLVVQKDGSSLMVRLIHGDGQSILLLSGQNVTIRRDAALKRLGFTNREAEVMNYVIQGKTSPQIGVILSISTRTVHKHLERVFHKLNVQTRSSAITRILEESSGSEIL
jgi:DNA-binding CsgD family transcriptional regulator